MIYRLRVYYKLIQHLLPDLQSLKLDCLNRNVQRAPAAGYRIAANAIGTESTKERTCDGRRTIIFFVKATELDDKPIERPKFQTQFQGDYRNKFQASAFVRSTYLSIIFYLSKSSTSCNKLAIKTQVLDCSECVSPIESKLIIPPIRIFQKQSSTISIL